MPPDSQLQFNPVLRVLMASSGYSPEDLQSRSLTVIREIVFRISSIVLTLTAGGSVIYISYGGLYVLAIVKTLVFSMLAVHDWLLFKYNRRLIAPRDIIPLGLISLMVSVAANFHEAVLWGFAFPIAAYLLAEKREALYLNIASWVICTVLALSVLTLKLALAFSASFVSIGILVEILCSILYRNEESLKRLVVRDPLTGAYNRRAMEEEMEHALLLFQRYHKSASIIVIDIDRFKSINDSFGHKEGDMVLVNLVNLILERIRTTDKLYRFGGEEFVVILTETSREQAISVAVSLCELVRNTSLSSKTQTTISCGVTECRDGDTLREWIHRGDTALYRAKNSGRDRVEFE